MRLKVLFVIENISVGGAERVFVNLLNNINNIIFDPVLVIINRGWHGNTYKTPKGVRLINLDTKKTKALIPLARTIKKEKPDVVFSNLAPINILCLMSKLLLRNNQTRYIIRETTIRSISISETKSNPLIRFLYTQLVRIFYPYADSIVALSNGSKEDLIANYGIDAEKIEVIYNPIDTVNIVSNSMEKVNDFPKWDSKFNLISVGSLVKSKGYEYLIGAMKELITNRCQNIRLIILGTGPLENQLKELVTQYNLNNYIKFLGFRENPFKYMRKCDAFILPALWEGFGNVITEAMACELPVISTSCESGPKEIIEHSETGILVEPKNIGALVTAIQTLMDNPDYANTLAKNALRRVKDFDVSIIIKQYEQHILAVFNRR
ncbi:MAG: glycosyltransferase [Dethiobacteria bacterium]